MSRAGEEFMEQRARSLQQFGSVLLFAGACGILLMLIDSGNGLARINMPRFWYVNRPLWYALGLGAFIAGALLIRRGTVPPIAWRPTQEGKRFRTMALYTRPGCHLCEEAGRLLARYKEFLPPMAEVNIDEQPELQEKFNTCVPVVEIDGKVRFRGHVSETLLRRLIEGTPPQ